MGGGAHSAFTLGGIVSIGGIAGYMKGSTASLIAGCGSGGVLVGAGYMINEGQNMEGHG
jgi:uncharacterized membrane protein (UPF0136 family)